MQRSIILAVLVLSAGCALVGGNNSRSASTGVLPNDYLGYQPIDPLPAKRVEIYDGSNGQMEEALWVSITDGNQVRDLLPLQSAQVSVSRIDESGAIRYVSDSVTGGRGIYMVVMDYMKYRVEDVFDEKGQEYVGNGRIGVGLRIRAVVNTSQAKLNVGSLLALGLEAERKALQGSICVDVVGIDSADVTNLIPLTSEIDQTSIQAALQALASIKTKVFDGDTKLTPHLVAVRQARAGMAEVIKDETALARLKGMTQALSLKEKAAKILRYAAPNNTLVLDKWTGLIDSSKLSDEAKDELKKCSDFETAEERLSVDAAMSGTAILALYDKLPDNSHN